MKFPDLNKEASLKSHKDFYSNDAEIYVENLNMKEDEIDILFAPLMK